MDRIADTNLLSYAHEPMVLDGDGEKTDTHLPMIHIAFSNLKTWLLGTHHGVSQQHLQAYLNEFVFRFNRRFYPMTAQLYLGNSGTCFGTYLRDTLQRRVDSPDSRIDNKPDRQGSNLFGPSQ